MRAVPADVRVFFQDETLRQLLTIRDCLLRDVLSRSAKKRQAAEFVLAATLGILHGHSSVSLSVSSSHAFSMAPGYVRRFAKEHNLIPPKRDVKECLIKKAKQLLEKCLLHPVPSSVKLVDARRCSSKFPNLVGRVDVILTSPPYLAAQTYAKDNWLRLWLLGHDYRTLHPEYIHTGSISRYSEMMRSIFPQFNRLLRKGGLLICVAGDVRLPRAKRPGRY